MKHLFRRLVCLSLALTMSGCIFFTTALGAETAQAPAAPVQSESAPALPSPTPAAPESDGVEPPKSPTDAGETPVPPVSPAPEATPAPEAAVPEASATPAPEEDAPAAEPPQPSATPQALAFALSAAPAIDYPYTAEDPFPAPHMGGMIINGYHTYCVEEDRAWPSAGSAYGDGGELPVFAEVKAQLLRALEAGYPQDALGLSALQPGLSAQVLATYTQWVIWNILNPGHYDMGADAVYFQALRRYALTGEAETGRVDQVTVSAAAPTLRYDSKGRPCWR